jgi:3-phenylpropionate/trans-cinnamate dioxygenase ferredoxin reductase component
VDSSHTLLIVGAGNAGAELATSTRQLGWPGPILLLGDEEQLPYHRPPLSKAYMCGAATSESLSIRPVSAYEKAGVTLHLGARAVQIDRAGKTLRLSDGTILSYAKLALCTGGRPRLLSADSLPVSGPPQNLYYLRTQADADAIRESVMAGTRLVIVGGGYVGLEVAASARKLGATVTVLEAQARVLARVTGPELSAFYEGVHRDAGVTIHTGVTLKHVLSTGVGAVQAVVCSDGSRIDADVVVVGVGMLPNVELAEEAGLDVDGGIVVDELSVSSDPDIVCAGDCTVHDSALYGRRIRLESVPNALEQARVAASGLCGKPIPNRAVPWFWSDQYDLKLQMVGLSAGYDTFVLRGSLLSRTFIGFYLRGGVLLAADAVNRPADFTLTKRLVGSVVGLDAKVLSDESHSLKDLLARLASTKTPILPNATSVRGPGSATPT